MRVLVVQNLTCVNKIACECRYQLDNIGANRRLEEHSEILCEFYKRDTKDCVSSSASTLRPTWYGLVVGGLTRRDESKNFWRERESYI